MAFLKKSKKENPETSETMAVERAQMQSAGHIGILRHPHITEKTAAAGNDRTYVFAVHPDANKIQIKRAVESRYGVKVADVRVVNIRGKEIRRGARVGRKPGIKKAYATIAEGQTIEIE